MVLAALHAPMSAAARPDDLDEQLRNRLQSQLAPETVPPPGSELIRWGTIGIIGGVALGSGGIWAAVQGLEYRDEAADLYAAYMDIGYASDPDTYNDAWQSYRDTELQSTGYRVGGSLAAIGGMALVLRSMFWVREAAVQSRELASEKGELPGEGESQASDSALSRRALSGGRLQLHPQGVSVIWQY